MPDPAIPKPSARPLRLADFIRANIEPIVAEWVRFARTREPASESMTEPALKDHIVELLAFIADDLETPQTKKEQFQKSRGLGSADGQFTRSAAEIHATLRLSDGFNIDQMVSEYRALRASVVKQWTATDLVLPTTDLEDLTRFNEAIDQALTESVAEYTKMINQSRDMFLGVLGHDLRNPIGAVLMTARTMLERGTVDSRQGMLGGQIAKAMERATSILDDLLELTRSAFGMEIPLVRTPMKMDELGAQLVEEMRTLSNGRQIEIETLGDTQGEWDRARMGQVFSNLIGNALQYSPEDGSITVTISDQEDRVCVSVHNEGDPIPADKQKTIFQSLARGVDRGFQGAGSTNLGLGLFIAHKIVAAHGGTLSVDSGPDSGTTFTAVVPKY
ncbi:sensor histidine kinase [Stakelama saccharophila]|uniref:histidine kinase n=1 Tax=Stakelama saccharophila TaxID=3075605 RepID=A0ABZ0B5Z9_9SPHN|nr:sensor histidine kinase [Stakelama sp. W311]WNO52822.1 sensor histidine kinase [Stakelama sp. W311]